MFVLVWARRAGFYSASSGDPGFVFQKDRRRREEGGGVVEPFFERRVRAGE